MKKIISLLLVFGILLCGGFVLSSCVVINEPFDNSGDDDSSGNNNGGTENGGAENGNPETDVKTPNELTYKEYLTMTSEEQRAHYDSFENADAFFVWYNAAKKKYEEDQNREEITDSDTPIELD